MDTDTATQARHTNTTKIKNTHEILVSCPIYVSDTCPTWYSSTLVGHGTTPHLKCP